MMARSRVDADTAVATARGTIAIRIGGRVDSARHEFPGQRVDGMTIAGHGPQRPWSALRIVCPLLIRQTCSAATGMPVPAPQLWCGVTRSFDVS